MADPNDAINSDVQSAASLCFCTSIMANIGESLAWGRFLYVDDLVTSLQHRSKGFGAKLLSWLREYAVAENCQQLHLDSGIQREDAHRFYKREGMSKGSFHFVESLSPD